MLVLPIAAAAVVLQFGVLRVVVVAVVVVAVSAHARRGGISIMAPKTGATVNLI